MQVQSSEQTLFNFLILGKSRFPPKKFYNINYWEEVQIFAHRDDNPEYEDEQGRKGGQAGGLEPQSEVIVKPWHLNNGSKLGRWIMTSSKVISLIIGI